MKKLGKKHRKAQEPQGEPQTIQLDVSDVALVLRGDGRCETICTLKGKHSLTAQEEIIIGLGGLMQQEKFVSSIREHFFSTMQKMLSTKMVDDLANDEG